jgi:PAS domain S-box-containing protein
VKPTPSILRLFAEMLAIVASVECAIMFLLPAIAPNLHGVGENILDTSLLIGGAGPLLFWRLHAASRRAGSEAAWHNAPNTPAEESSRWAMSLAMGVFLIGLGCSLFGAWKSHEGIIEAARGRFERRAERVETEVKRRLQVAIYGLRGLRGPFTVMDKVGRADFRDYVMSRDMKNEFPGAIGMGYIERVPRARLGEYVAAVRATDDPAFTVSTSGDLPEVYATRFIEPLEDNRAVLGWDIGVSPERREACDRAMLSGEPAFTASVTRLGDEAKRPGLRCYLPVYRRGTSPATPEERRRDLVGWVYMPMRVETVLAGVGNIADRHVEFELYQGRLTTRQSLLYDDDGEPHAVPDAAPGKGEDSSMFRRRAVITMGGREWTLWLGTTPVFNAEIDRSTALFAGAAGVCTSLLLALSIWGLGSGRARAVALAARMTEEFRSSEEQARQALARVSAYRMALNQHAIVAVTDISGTILEVNEPFCRISGYAREELVGARHSIVNSGHHSKEFWVQMWRIIAKGGIWRAEVCNKAKDGSLYWVDTTIGPVRDAAGKIEGYIAIRFDVSERKRAEQRLTDALGAAESANRAKSAFLANMSHEVRTPLTAILGYADLLREEGDLSAAPKHRVETIDTIRRSGQHLLTVINDILDISKIEANKLAVEFMEVEIAEQIAEIESLLRPRAMGRGLKLELRLGTPVPERVRTDPTRFRQILLNLAGNAVKFTERGGVTITVHAEQAGGEGGDGWLIVDVEDTGPGLKPEHAGRIFTAFSQADSTTSRRFGGSGLGLTISRRLARLMGGDVTLLRTEPGRGSCFRLELPLNAVAGSTMLTSLDAVKPKLPAGAAGPSGAAAGDGPVTLRGRVLLAEDGPDNQRLIAFHLRRAGAEVVVADNGLLALDQLSTHAAAGKPFDLLVTDMQMPEMDGYELASELRRRGSTLAIVALTAHAMAEDREKCLAAGCDDYAPKPIDKQQLLAVCAAWIGKPGGVNKVGGPTPAA